MPSAETAAGAAGGPDPHQSSPPGTEWARTVVDGASVRYAVSGQGPDALFLHGWGLRPQAYREAIRQMGLAGCRVVAPAMPGFGGTRELPPAELSFTGYASWAARFLESLGIGDVALVAGHSFGGGVATQFAHDHPGRCGSLLLANAIGSPVWELFAEEVHTMAARPVWDWGRHLSRELWAAPGFLRLFPALMENLMANLMSNPFALWRIGEFIRRADLSGELAVLAARGLPVEVLWSDRDGLVPRSAFDEIRRAVGVEGKVVEGSHSWLLADAAPFGEAAVRCLVDAGVVGASQLRPAL